MKKLRINPIWKPLKVSQDIVVSGVSPIRQVFDRGAGAYIPDRRLVPLVLTPKIVATNPNSEGDMPSGDVSALLFDAVWTEIIGGVSRVLDASTIASDTFTIGSNVYNTYSIGSDYTLTVRKNTTSLLPATYVFTAKFADGRQSGIYHDVYCSVLSTSVTVESMPTLHLSVPERIFYNPLRDTTQNVSVAASLKIKTDEVAAANRLFKWEVRKADDAAWEVLGSDVLHYYADLQADGKTVVVNLPTMGYGFALRCTAAFNPEGAATDAYFNAFSPSKTVLFDRRMTKWDYDIAQMPASIPPEQSVVRPTALVWDKEGPIDNPGDTFSIKWSAMKNTSGQSYEVVAYGETPTIPTAKMDSDKGMMLGLEVEDLGPLMAWADSDGKILTEVNAEGKQVILLIK